MASAKFGLEGKRERILGIDADHSGMCRFDPSNQQDKDNLEKVMSSVEDLYILALEKAKDSEISSSSDLRAVKKKILKWLYRSEHEDTFETDLARHHAMDDTCIWLYKRHEYESWFSPPSASLLWINGIPGSGKSFLSAHAVRSLQKTGRKVFYFFCNNDYEDTRLLTRILGCLLHQMLLADSQVLRIVSPYHDKSTQKRILSLETASQIFKDVLATISPCYIVIDAMDECVDRLSLIQLLCSVVSAASKDIKVFAVSRDEADIRRSISQYSNVLELQIREIDVSNDIKRVVKGLVSGSYELSSKLEHYSSLKRDVVNGLIKAAQGMFLLPKFMIMDLETKAEVDEIYECLNDVPIDLNSYYISTMSRMDARRRPIAKNVFTWVLRTKRPLSLEEIKAAMSLDGSRFLNLQSDIRSSCGCLIRVENNQVRLSHNTVKQFLLESDIFRDHPLRPCYLDEKGHEYIADVTSRYIFRHKFRVPLTQSARFLPVDLDGIRKAYPFLEYAAWHWIEHCRESQFPIRFLADVSTFLNSPRFSTWYEAANTFNYHEGFPMLFDQLQQWFLSLGLPTNRGPLEKANIAVATASKISQLWTFIESWESALKVFPSEIHNLDQSINPQRQFSQTMQRTLQTTKAMGSDEERQLYNLVDGHSIGFGVDRFLIGATSIFSWNSLMQSEAWDVAFTRNIDPNEPAQIRLNVQNLYSRCVESREGLATAGIDRLTAHAILRPDLGAVAIVWVCFDPDRTNNLTVKSYAWNMRPDPVCIMLKIIEWTDKVDPCRVDITISSTFAGSRAALAFQKGGKLWTPGGAYELESGSIKERPPDLFDDPDISQLTFSRDASMIAGIREGVGIEVYSMPRCFLPDIAEEEDFDKLSQCSLLAKAEGNVEILGMSPFGSYCLYIQTSIASGKANPPSDSNPYDQDRGEEVRILKILDNVHQIVWRPQEKVKRARNSDELLTLHHFYNSGGLFAFSESETVLVLCVPTQPSWNIVAFDLQEAKTANTVWTVDCANILMGMNPICLSFCPFNDRRLYILNNFGTIRAAQISRKDTTSSASILTTRQGDSNPTLSGIRITSCRPQLIVLEIQDSHMEAFCWDLQAMGTMRPLQMVSLPWIRILARLKIDSLRIDIDAMLDIANLSSACRWDYERECRIFLILQKRMQRNYRVILRYCKFLRSDTGSTAESLHSAVDDSIVQQEDVSNNPGTYEAHVQSQNTVSDINTENATEVGISCAKSAEAENMGLSPEDELEGPKETVIKQSALGIFQLESMPKSAIASRPTSRFVPTGEGAAVSENAPSHHESNITTESTKAIPPASKSIPTMKTPSSEQKIFPCLQPSAKGDLPESEDIAATSQKIDTTSSTPQCDTADENTRIPECQDQEFSEQEDEDASNTVSDDGIETICHSITSMIFSPCGRYIYGTSTWTEAFIEIIDTWRIEENRVLYIPHLLRTAKNFTISHWRDHIMLVGNLDSTIVAARVHVDERASFFGACLAVAPSTVENATGFKVLWPEDTSGEGLITIISQNGNQILKDGEVGGNTGWPFVIKVKEKDIGAWSEPFLEPEVFTEHDFPKRYPLVDVFV
ncbi:MAG: hypothetical protein Q9164_004231 [Protoblastenia rupestris]